MKPRFTIEDGKIMGFPTPFEATRTDMLGRGVLGFEAVCVLLNAAYKFGQIEPSALNKYDGPTQRAVSAQIIDAANALPNDDEDAAAIAREQDAQVNRTRTATAARIKIEPHGEMNQ